MSEKLLTVSSSPHIRGTQTTRSLMTDVLIALTPAAILSVVFFGYKSIILILVCVGACIASEAVAQKIRKKDITIGDMSAAVTGLLLALNLPINCPWWVALIGSVSAIVIVKQLFGGIGCNFVNPALAARIILVASWPQHMTGGAFLPVDAIASATPLALAKAGEMASTPSIMQLFIGNGVYGCIGEVSALALLLGGAYLVFRKVISARIPLVYLGTVALFSLLAGHNILFELFSGGLMLGAIFMATDYVTSPSTTKGQIIFAIGCGVITCIIRFYGGYPEGVSFSIIMMNVASPLIDKYIRPKKYGEVKKKCAK